MIALTPVVSSNIAAHGYEASSKTLAIRFTGGSNKVYQYQHVPPDVAAEFAKAESIGRAFASMIRGKFEHSIVLDEETT
jgi:hypothetical protein